MTFVHGKDTVVTLSATDLSAAWNNTDWERSSDEHDVTCYGKAAHVLQGGLLGGKVTGSGVYANGASGPRAVIEPLIGTNVTLILKPEGTGTGKPQRSVSVLVKSYKESAPVADYIRWTADFTMSDVVTYTTL